MRPIEVFFTGGDKVKLGSLRACGGTCPYARVAAPCPNQWS